MRFMIDCGSREVISHTACSILTTLDSDEKEAPGPLGKSGPLSFGILYA